jgi:3-methylcrotonyl-CoA carboxylase alpha subunit
VEVRLRRGTRELAVRLVAEGDGFVATIDDVAYRVASAASGPRTAAGASSVEELALVVDGRPQRAVVARTRDRILVALGGRVYAFEAGDEARAGHDGGAGSGLIVAPMPGKVISILVAVGDQIEAGEPVVVLEAMKMESTLPAEVSGRVTAVRVAAGTVVGAGDILVEIGPADE